MNTNVNEQRNPPMPGYGPGPRTSDNIDELDILTYDGLRLRVGPAPEEELAAIIAAGGRRAEIYAGLERIAGTYADAIWTGLPDIPRRVSGYNLDELLPEKGFNVARALVGSEGTCALVLEATTRLVHSPPNAAWSCWATRTSARPGTTCPG